MLVLHRSEKAGRSQPRRAIASLELVLSTPFLAVLAVLILSVGNLCNRKSDVLIEARREAWRQRDGRLTNTSLPVTVTGGLFNTNIGLIDEQLNSDPAKGLHKQTSFRSLKVIYPGATALVVEGKQEQLRSHHEVVDGTWDSDTLPFKDDRTALGPDLDHFKRFGSFNALLPFP